MKLLTNRYFVIAASSVLTVILILSMLGFNPFTLNKQ